MVKACYSLVLKLLDFASQNGAAPSAKDAYMRASIGIELLTQIVKVFHMAPLIGADTNGIDIFLNGCGDKVFDTAVVSNMDHFESTRLEQASEHID
jgi:hypothetical protein